MKKTKIVIATGNADKTREFKEILGEENYEILSMKEAGIEAEIIEDGKTFVENARIKAVAVSELVDEMVIADDSGLVIDALGGEPGVHSARYLGEDTSYELKNQKILELLSDVPREKRTARFVCAMVAVLPDGRELSSEGVIEGYIGYEAKGKGGFGYDPIFYVEKYGTSTADISPEEKNAISHRGQALREIKRQIESS